MKMQEINKVSSKGGGPTHIADHTGRCVFAANYGGGSVASFQVNSKGQLSKAVSFFQYSADEEKHERKPHAQRLNYVLQVPGLCITKLLDLFMFQGARSTKLMRDQSYICQMLDDFHLLKGLQ
jgi:6-phosphogluconolactonase (cycloisomerase 2 family)